ncbi:APC membrane recruitment protein 3 isoform X2 [Bombina bombina]|nr:APC membrane recruitment protein 3 isoform X2 [Bombina bombina]
MELIRGKTFIKNYAQNPPEKLPYIGVKVKKNVLSERILGECDTKKESIKGTGVSENKESFGSPKCVRKSKTHDCVTREISSEIVKDRLPSSRSFSAVENSLNTSDIGNNPNIKIQTNYDQHMIDYRNFAPLMPFVPSVAKSLPKKRISLKRSKKSLKNIFQFKKNKQQGITPIAENERLYPLVLEMEKGKRNAEQLRNTNEIFPDEMLTPEYLDSEMYIDTIEYCRSLCEDVASLKSFDSFTGCGEIFADEISAEIEHCKGGHKLKFHTKEIPVVESFQGGVEQLASPAKSEITEFSRVCGHDTKPPTAKNFCSNLIFDSTFVKTSNDLMETNQEHSRDDFPNSSSNDLVLPNENVAEAGSPVSTSDEGYYDSYSPGMEDEKKETETPSYMQRDSYSGDALYELFCDPNESTPSPLVDCDLSVSGQNTDAPMSIYSFCVGSEEKMASQSDSILENGNLNSSWKGRECFLKLCDTELTLTMGLVNWLKKTGKLNEFQDPNPNDLSSSEQCAQKEISEKIHVEENKPTLICKEASNKDTEETMTSVNTDNQSKVNKLNTLENHNINVICTAQRESKTINVAELNFDQKSVSKKISDDNVANNKSLPKPLQIGSKEKHELELLNPYIKDVAHIDTMRIICNKNVLPPQNKDLQSPCVTSGVPDHDNNVIQSMEQCATQVSSLQITCKDQSMNQEKTICPQNILQSYEVSKNCRNSEIQDSVSRQNILYRVLSDTSQLESSKSNLKLPYSKESALTPLKNSICLFAECKENLEYNQNPAQECTGKTGSDQQLLSNKSQTTNFVSRPNLLPLFSSSVISSCSSTMYKMRNAGKPLVFFNTPEKSNKPIGNYQEIDQDFHLPFQAVSMIGLTEQNEESSN